jgi:hypothetical protein
VNTTAKTMHIISKAFTRGLLPDLFKEDAPALF